MLNVIPSLKKFRKFVFTELVDWEIFHRISSHLNHEADHDYEFGTDQELEAQNDQLLVKLYSQIAEIKQLESRTPKAYAMAFRNIAYRDLSARTQKYLILATQRATRTAAPNLSAKVMA